MKYTFLVCILIVSETTCEKENATEIDGDMVYDEEGEGERIIEEPSLLPKILEDVEENYLEDLVSALKKQNWTSDEQPCLQEILHLINSVQNFTLWAVWQWDAISKEPQSVLYGGRYQLGNFDECMEKPWPEYHKELTTQYCLVDIVLDPADSYSRGTTLDPYQSALDWILRHKSQPVEIDKITWGICVPATCQAESVQRLVEAMLSRTYLAPGEIAPRLSMPERCQKVDDNTRYDGAFYGFVSSMGVLAVICLICTWLNIGKTEDSLFSNITKAFCLKSNARDLLVMKKEGTEVMYGIRFLSICVIVFDHQIGISLSGALSDSTRSEMYMNSALGTLFVHTDLSVDSFFLISGFLAARGVSKMKTFRFPFWLIVKRYLRLAPAVAIVVYYVAAVLPYTGSGPLWARTIAAEAEACKKNWWTNLLMVNNYVDTRNMCLIISWYVPCDFHFTAIALLLFWLYKRTRKVAIVVTAAVSLASLIIPAAITYLYYQPAVQLFTFDFLANPRAHDQFHFTYIKSHFRMAAYIVGFFAGYFFSWYKTFGRRKKISTNWATLGAFASIALMLSVLLSGATFLTRRHPISETLYAALNRPLWTFGLAVFLLSCSIGHVPILKSFLSWYPWVPLSRLSYGLYLTHGVFIIRDVFIAKNPSHMDTMMVLVLTLGHLVLGCFAALIMWLLLEAPVSNLFSLCFIRPKPIKTEVQSPSSPTVNGNRVDIMTSSVTPTPNGNRDATFHSYRL